MEVPLSAVPLGASFKFRPGTTLRCTLTEDWADAQSVKLSSVQKMTKERITGGICFIKDSLGTIFGVKQSAINGTYVKISRRNAW